MSQQKRSCTNVPLLSLPVSQVGDFLSGRSPLTLALRVGDHMMFVQLQLAAQNSTVQQCPTRGPSGTARIPTVPCGGSNEHPHTPPTAHKNHRASPGQHTNHAHLSPPSSPTLSPGSIHYPHLGTGACSPAPRAPTPFKQVKRINLKIIKMHITYYNNMCYRH